MRGRKWAVARGIEPNHRLALSSSFQLPDAHFAQQELGFLVQRGMKSKANAPRGMNLIVFDRAHLRRVLFRHHYRARVELAELEAVDPNEDLWIGTDATNPDNIPESSIPFLEKVDQLTALEQLVAGYRVIVRAAVILKVEVSTGPNASLLASFVEHEGAGGASGRFREADRSLFEVVQAEGDSLSRCTGPEQEAGGGLPRGTVFKGEFEVGKDRLAD